MSNALSDQLRMIADMAETGSVYLTQIDVAHNGIDRDRVEMQISLVGWTNREGFRPEAFGQKELDTGRKIQPTKAWVINGGNSILENYKEEFYISYNASPTIGNTGHSETAIVKDGRFYILNGDHREAYEKLIDRGYSACVRYFKEHDDEVSSWSNPLDDEEAA